MHGADGFPSGPGPCAVGWCGTRAPCAARGRRYADEQHHSRGTGGYAQYNRAWSTRTWDDGITDELDITEDRKREIRLALAAAKQRAAGPADEPVAEPDDDAERGGNGALVLAVGAVLVAASAYGIRTAAPYVRKFLADKAAPRIRRPRQSGPAGREPARPAQDQ
ncbi:hypothetical protein AB0G32_36905 [Streptomyces sp. NPDC023723]|uniref:hypothetical protein n=1 Tax=Streptomyces sp. NPDC023723 TaxID=3154323 RepID=UPI0033C95260